MNNQQVQMTEAVFGVGNNQHDHYSRTSMMNISPTGVDELFVSKMNNGFVPPSIIENVARDSAGITTQSSGVSYIENGWGVSRGICKLKFTTRCTAESEQHVIMVCYLYGGSVNAEAGITPDTMIVPVKSWIIDLANRTDHQGLPAVFAQYHEGMNILLDDPTEMTGRGMVTLRPQDIVTSAQIAAYASMENGGMPVNPTDMAPGNAMLRNRGTLVSGSTNDSTVRHSAKLLEAAVRYGHNKSQNGYDDMGALNDAASSQTLREIGIDANPVFSYIQACFGKTYMSGFSGWSVGELTSMFPELGKPGFAKVEMLDMSRFTALDRRLDCKNFGTSSPSELFATELHHIMLSELFQRKLSRVKFSVTNNVPNDQRHLAVNGVLFVVGEFMPLADEDLQAPMNVEYFKQSIISQFYSRFDPNNSGYPSNIVSFVVDSDLISETNITVYLNGDNDNGVMYSYASFGSNRDNLNLDSASVATTVAVNMFNNLREHFTL